MGSYLCNRDLSDSRAEDGLDRNEKSGRQNN